MTRRASLILALITVSLALISCAMPQTPVVTSTPTPSLSESPTPSSTPSASPTVTSTLTVTPTETAGSPSPTESPSASPTATGATSQSGGVVEASIRPQKASSPRATLVIDPFPPVVMKEARLRLSLRDADGRPVPGAAVSFDLTMPDMTMPPNKPLATERANGAYEAPAIFTMPGLWQILASVSIAGDTEQFVYELEIK